MAIFPVASPAQKSGGPKLFSLLVSSKIYNIHAWDTPHIYIKTFQRICAILRRGLNRSGGSGPPIPPVVTPLNISFHNLTEYHKGGTQLDFFPLSIPLADFSNQLDRVVDTR